VLSSMDAGLLDVIGYDRVAVPEPSSVLLVLPLLGMALKRSRAKVRA